MHFFVVGVLGLWGIFNTLVGIIGTNGHRERARSILVWSMRFGVAFCSLTLIVCLILGDWWGLFLLFGVAGGAALLTVFDNMPDAPADPLIGADRDLRFEIFRNADGRDLRVHAAGLCLGENCPLHSPSDHPLKAGPLQWRGDLGIFERLCDHSVGHPDPDSLDYKETLVGPDMAEAIGMHSCDGCCSPAPTPETTN